MQDTRKKNFVILGILIVTIGFIFALSIVQMNRGVQNAYEKQYNTTK